MIPCRLKPVEFHALVLKDSVTINEGLEGKATYGGPGDVLLQDSEGYLRVISKAEFDQRFELHAPEHHRLRKAAATERANTLEAQAAAATRMLTPKKASLSQTIRELLREKPMSLEDILDAALKVHPDTDQKKVYAALHTLKGKDPSEAYKQDVDGKWALTNAGRIAAKKAGE